MKESPTPKLAIVSEPPNESDSDTQAPQGYTLADQVDRNAQLIRELADRYNIDPAVVVTLFTTTMNIHFTKIQLGLAAPVEN